MKGISFVEKHFEKAAALLVTVLMCSYLVWDFMDPSAVKMGPNAAVTPVQVNQLLSKQAESLDKKQKSSEIGLQFDAFEAGTAKKSYAAQLQLGVSPVPKLRKNAPSLAAAMTPEERLGDNWYFEPQFGAATMLNPIAWYGDALEPDAVSKNEPLKKFLASQPDPGSLDVIWTRPTARVDLKAIRSELAREDKSASPPRLAAPPTWRNNAVYFIDVVFERQEQKLDGSWASPVVVPTMFGRQTFRDQKDLSPNAIFLSMRGEKSIENEIRQPDFYPTLHNSSKSDAQQKPTSGPTPAPTADKKKVQELEKLKEELITLEKDLQAAGGEWDDDIARKEAETKKKEKQSAGGDSGGGGGGGAGGGLKGGAGAAGPPTGDAGGAGKDKSKRKVLTEKTRNLRKKVKRLETELGIDSTKPVESGAEKPVERPATQADLDFIDVWTHDLTATLGKTYRYRCRVEIYNPFFGKKRQLVEQQKKLSDNVTIPTKFSEWSAPVRVPMKAMYFADGGVIGEPSAPSVRQIASFSVYVLKNGLWQSMDPKQSFEPGQPLIFHVKDRSDGDSSDGPGREIDSGWFIVDIVDDPNASPEKQRPTLPAVVLSRRDGSGQFEIRYPTREKLDADQLTLKGLVEDGKTAKPVAKSSGQAGGE
ncbi:MAG: hypothetical protein K8R92_01985 [Planctomycetes bacterium]|nr:hypothetical protein [Planctomycetota bacterium]